MQSYSIFLVTRRPSTGMIRILFLGQKWLGERCFDILQKLQSDSVCICGVVSNSSTEVWWQTNTIYQRCLSTGIPLIANDKRNDAAIVSMIAEMNVNTIISVQHPWIIPQESISLVNDRAFNLHNARLPTYRGHNACNHAILNGDQYYTSTLHWMVAEVDAGAIAFEETVEVAPDDTARSLYEKAIESGQMVFQRLLSHLMQRQPIPHKPISGTGVLYSRNSLDHFREIRDITNPEEVDRKSRALFFPPFEPAYYRLSGKKHYVLPANFHVFAHEFKASSSYLT